MNPFDRASSGTAMAIASEALLNSSPRVELTASIASGSNLSVPQVNDIGVSGLFSQ